MQRLRDLHLLQKQHQPTTPKSDNRDQLQEPLSFLPSSDRGLNWYITQVVILITTMSLVLFHDNVIARAPGSSDDCRTVPGAEWLLTLRPSQSTCAVNPAVGCYHLHPPLTFIVTQLEGWYSFCHPTEIRSRRDELNNDVEWAINDAVHGIRRWKDVLASVITADMGHYFFCNAPAVFLTEIIYACVIIIMIIITIIIIISV